MVSVTPPLKVLFVPERVRGALALFYTTESLPPPPSAISPLIVTPWGWVVPVFVPVLLMMRFLVVPPVMLPLMVSLELCFRPPSC